MTLDSLRAKITSVLESVDENTMFSDEVYVRVNTEITQAIEQFEEELLEKLDELKEDL